MSAINGTSVRLKIAIPPVPPATLPTFLKLRRETSAKMNVSVKDIDTTSKDNDGWEESIPGLMSGSLSGELIVDLVPLAGYVGSEQLKALTYGRQIQTFHLGTDNAGDPVEEFKGYFTKYDADYPMEGTVKVSFDLKVTSKPVPVV